jgi:hypothetical protein
MPRRIAILQGLFDVQNTRAPIAHNDDYSVPLNARHGPQKKLSYLGVHDDIAHNFGCCCDERIDCVLRQAFLYGELPCVLPSHDDI